MKVYRNRRTGQFRVQPHARHFGTPQEFGPPSFLAAHASDDELLRAVLDNLPKTETQKYELSLAAKHSVEERRRILKEEQPIIVRQTDLGYELAPMRRMKNSFGSIEELARTIPPNEFLSRGGEMIRALFDEAP